MNFDILLLLFILFKKPVQVLYLSQWIEFLIAWLVSTYLGAWEPGRRCSPEVLHSLLGLR